MEYNNQRPHESLNNLTPKEFRLMAEKPELLKSAWNYSWDTYNKTGYCVKKR